MLSKLIPFRRGLSSLAAALSEPIPSPVRFISPAAPKSLFHVSVHVSHPPSLSSFRRGLSGLAAARTEPILFTPSPVRPISPTSPESLFHVSHPPSLASFRRGLSSLAAARAEPILFTPSPVRSITPAATESLFHVTGHVSHPPSLCSFRRGLSSLAAALSEPKPILFTRSPIHSISPASPESLFHVTVDVSHSPSLSSSYSTPGQYLQLRLPNGKTTLLAIASPPEYSKKEFEFLVKSVPGSVAEMVCGVKKGEVVDVSCAMGRGFDVEQLCKPQRCETVLIFATGSGISPIRSLIESKFSSDKRSDVILYYGARNLRRMAYQDRFKDWESRGVKIVPVLSQPDDHWMGERGYVQAAFSRAKHIFNPQSTGAVLCGQRQMTEEVTSLLVADGISTRKILKNV